MKSLEIRHSSYKAWFLLAVIAIFSAFVVKWLYEDHTSGRISLSLAILIVSLMIYFFRMALLDVKKYKASMKLDETGITYLPMERHWGIATIPWSEISHTDAWRFGRSECLRLHLAKKDVCDTYKASKLHKLFYGNAITVNVMDLEGSAGSISNRIEEFRTQIASLERPH